MARLRVAGLTLDTAPAVQTPVEVLSMAISRLSGLIGDRELSLKINELVDAQVTKAGAQANSTASDVAGLVVDFNALLAKLRTAGVIS